MTKMNFGGGPGNRPGFAMLAALILLAVIDICPANTTAPISEATGACLTCHRTVTPGIVADWQRSRHARVTPSEALNRSELSRRVSASDLPDSLRDIVVGCVECHGQNAESHDDTFSHSSYQVHIVVSPPDCGVCHPHEKGQYGMNLMSHAHVNLAKNPFYQQLMRAINGVSRLSGDSLRIVEPDSFTTEQSCYFCHGTDVKVAGMIERQTTFGKMTFPQLDGWPNRGVGRLNPDGSMGSCTPCHARHQFAIEVARQPYTCSECHKGPDVPAYKVYSVSKHGNIFYSMKSSWQFDSVPWTLGKDFTAPTCAVCHISLIVDKTGNIVARRTHQMNDRLYVRLFGLIYAHAHPRSAATHFIQTEHGVPLPTGFDGEPVAEALIDAAEQQRRKTAMQQICRACHSEQWTVSHFAALDAVVASTNERTREATAIVQKAWNQGLADGVAADSNPFDEGIEKLWIRQWLFYANSVRLSTAMAGADYGVFADGRWWLADNMRQLYDKWQLLKRHTPRPESDTTTRSMWKEAGTYER